jgi:hypothetical protein
MTFINLNLCGAVLLALAPSVSSLAADEIACPPAGTVTRSINSLGEYTTRWQGADPIDSSICLSVDRQDAGAHNGKIRQRRRIFGWYDVDDMQGRDPNKIRVALAALLSGRSERHQSSNLIAGYFTCLGHSGQKGGRSPAEQR